MVWEIFFVARGETIVDDGSAIVFGAIAGYHYDDAWFYRRALWPCNLQLFVICRRHGVCVCECGVSRSSRQRSRQVGRPISAAVSPGVHTMNLQGIPGYNVLALSLAYTFTLVSY